MQYTKTIETEAGPVEVRGLTFDQMIDVQDNPDKYKGGAGTKAFLALVAPGVDVGALPCVDVRELVAATWAITRGTTEQEKN